jgi:histidinol phosphatase-like enzyme (inositol monophosphatase family)
MSFDLDLIGGMHAVRELIDEVLAGGEDALSAFRAGVAARTRLKQDRSPVTEADESVEKRLRAFIARRFPAAAFVGEETGTAGAADARLRFFVDPIDGTRAFVRGIPTWSVLVGLEHDGQPVLGIAFMPAAGDLFVAVRGQGAFANGRPIHLSTTERLSDATVCHGLVGDFARAGASAALPRLVDGVMTLRGHHDFDGYRQLLLGRADAMVDPGTTPWDLCAPAAIVTEAGGRLTSPAGTGTIHGGGGMASNGLIHDALVELLR